MLSTDDGYWNGIPHDRAMAWSRVFIDYPPRFPGATFMNLIYRSVRRGSPAGVLDWADTARAGESVGLSADLYYLLQLTLSVISADQYDRHPHNHRVMGADGRMRTPLDLSEWGQWGALVESGTTPLRATRLVLSGGSEGPRGLLIWDDGTIESTDDV